MFMWFLAKVFSPRSIDANGHFVEWNLRVRLKEKEKEESTLDELHT